MTRHKAVWLIFLTLSLSTMDGIATVVGVRSGAYGGELNPIMRFFLEKGLGVFFLAKFLLVAVPCCFLYWARREGWARYGLYFAVVLYFCVCLVHVRGLFGV